MKHICFYLSDHGFGHIARNLHLIQALLSYTDAKLTVVCGKTHLDFAREYLLGEFGESIFKQNRLYFRPEHTDVGLILQPGTLLVDSKKLERETTQFLSLLPNRSKEEAIWLLNNKVDAAVCDMPLWSIEACKLAGVPLLYIGNFTWTELYREHLPQNIWQAYGAEYKKLEHVMLYALHNKEMLEFVGNAPDIKTISVQSRKFHPYQSHLFTKQFTQPIVFVALGMSAEFTEKIDVSQLPYHFVVNAGVPLRGHNVTRLDVSVCNTQDYILASDYVITKAGWGTVAECILAERPMALFERDSVLEDRNTIQMLCEQKMAVSLTQEDLKNIPAVIKKMEETISRKNFGKYYSCTKEIVEHLLKIAK